MAYAPYLDDSGAFYWGTHDVSVPPFWVSPHLNDRNAEYYYCYLIGGTGQGLTVDPFEMGKVLEFWLRMWAATGNGALIMGGINICAAVGSMTTAWYAICIRHRP